MSDMTTWYAMQFVGGWVRLADALLHEGALGNAASAVHHDQQRSAREAVELAAVDMRAGAALTATG